MQAIDWKCSATTAGQWCTSVYTLCKHANIALPVSVHMWVIERCSLVWHTYTVQCAAKRFLDQLFSSHPLFFFSSIDWNERRVSLGQTEARRIMTKPTYEKSWRTLLSLCHVPYTGWNLRGCRSSIVLRCACGDCSLVLAINLDSFIIHILQITPILSSPSNWRLLSLEHIGVAFVWNFLNSKQTNQKCADSLKLFNFKPIRKGSFCMRPTIWCCTIFRFWCFFTVCLFSTTDLYSIVIPGFLIRWSPVEIPKYKTFTQKIYEQQYLIVTYGRQQTATIHARFVYAKLYHIKQSYLSLSLLRALVLKSVFYIFITFWLNQNPSDACDFDRAFAIRLSCVWVEYVLLYAQVCSVNLSMHCII